MTATTGAPPTPSLEHAYQQALRLTLRLAVSHHQAGRSREAEQLYRAVLQSEPGQPQAHHNLGLLLLQLRKPARGLPHLEAALAAKPESERYWLTYIEALAQDGQTVLAREMLAFAREHGLDGDAAQALAARLNVGEPAARSGSALSVGA